MSTALANVQRGAVATRSFTGTSIEHRGETAATAAAEAAKAQVQARYLMALQRPRDVAVCRQRLLDACKRPRFAELATYSKPVGGGSVTGPSIRFAEEALRSLGNVLPETTVVYDDDERRVIRISVTDLEANLTHSKDVVIEKIVERKNAAGREVLGERPNTTGGKVFIVRATEDEIANKAASAESKALRQLALRILPGDLLDDAMAQVLVTKKADAAKDPREAIKKLADAFAERGIRADQLAKYLGHAVDDTTPDEIVALRSVYAAIRDGETTWTAVMEDRDGERAGDVRAPEPAKTAAPPPAPKAAAAAPEPVAAEVVPASAAPPPDLDQVAGEMPPWAGGTAAPLTREEQEFAQALDLIQAAETVADLQKVAKAAQGRFAGTNKAELEAAYKAKKAELQAGGEAS